MQWRIKLHRQIQDNPLRLQETFSRWQARVDILLLANHDSGSFRIRGNIVNVKRGQFAYAETTIAMRWKRSRNKLRNFFAELEESKMLVQHKNRLISIYTIVNYELYQTTDWTTESTTEGQQKNINKNDKNEKNIFIPPSLDDVKDYCEERRNWIDAEAFIASYASSGWTLKNGKKIKDRKACVTTWEKRKKQRDAEREPKTMQEFADLYNKVWIQEFTKRYWVDKARETKLYMF